jgi:hypothetical protein
MKMQITFVTELKINQQSDYETGKSTCHRNPESSV